MSAGTTVGKYELLKCLARGATTDLWLARTRGIAGFERHVVIKRCHEQQAQDPGFVQAFMTEARLAGALHHNNIIQVQDIGDDGGIPYFAMEYVHGADMRTVLAALTKQRLRLPLEHVIAIVSTTAQALHHAHNASTPDGKALAIVHRDVTPANILVSFDGNVKVGDFGIAKAAITLQTQVGVLKGRSPYMAPEQCMGQPVDCRSDVFALGIVLWEMLTMRRLYKGNTDHEVMQTIVTSTPPKPTSVYTYIPKQLEVITFKALAKEPINRYQSAAELATALEAVASALGRTSTTSTLAAFLAKHLGERPEPWLVVSDRVEKRASVDFDSDEASGDEFEADTQKDIVPAPPKPALPAPNVAKPIVPADSVVVAAELENVVERGDTENDAVGATQTAMPPPPPAQRKRAGKKSEPTQIVKPLDAELLAERPRKRTLLVGASGCVVAILIAIVAGKLVASTDTSAAVLDTAKPVEPVERTPVATGPTHIADPAPAPPAATNPPAPANPEPSPAPAAPPIDPSTAANGGYASHPGSSIPEPPREGPGLGDFATGSGNVPKREPVAEPAPPKAEPTNAEPAKVEPALVEAPKPAPLVEAPKHVVEAPKPVVKKPIVVKKPAAAKKPAAPKPKYDPDSLFLKVPK